MSWFQAVGPWPEGLFLSGSNSTEIGVMMSMCWLHISHCSKTWRIADSNSGMVPLESGMRNPVGGMGCVLTWEARGLG